MGRNRTSSKHKRTTTSRCYSTKPSPESKKDSRDSSQFNDNPMSFQDLARENYSRFGPPPVPSSILMGSSRPRSFVKRSGVPSFTMKLIEYSNEMERAQKAREACKARKARKSSASSAKKRRRVPSTIEKYLVFDEVLGRAHVSPSSDATETPRKNRFDRDTIRGTQGRVVHASEKASPKKVPIVFTDHHRVKVVVIKTNGTAQTDKEIVDDQEEQMKSDEPTTTHDMSTDIDMEVAPGAIHDPLEKLADNQQEQTESDEPITTRGMSSDIDMEDALASKDAPLANLANNPHPPVENGQDTIRSRHENISESMQVLSQNGTTHTQIAPDNVAGIGYPLVENLLGLIQSPAEDEHLFAALPEQQPRSSSSIGLIDEHSLLSSCGGHIQTPLYLSSEQQPFEPIDPIDEFTTLSSYGECITFGEEGASTSAPVQTDTAPVDVVLTQASNEAEAILAVEQSVSNLPTNLHDHGPWTCHNCLFLHQGGVTPVSCEKCSHIKCTWCVYMMMRYPKN